MSNPGCPEIKPIESFYIEKFFGRWYQLYRYEDSFTDGMTGDCVVIDFSLRPDYLIKIKNTGLDHNG